jgi:ABC-type uncharacterized transport system permease subunit
LRLLILGVFGIHCLDFGINTIFEIFNYLMSKSNVGYNMLKCLFGSVSYKFHLKLILALKTQASELALNFAHHRT